MTAQMVLFVVGAVVSLGASWILVTRIERMGAQLGVTEAMLGLVAALAADAPEITAAISALSSQQADIGAGVVIGSNVFNLAALLGLGAVVAGWVALHRRVVLLAGAVSIWVAVVCVVTLIGVIPPLAGLVLVLAALGPYVWLAASRRSFDAPALRWLRSAMNEEETEIHPMLVPRRVRSDPWVAGGALVLVVAASVLMERAAQSVGRHFSISGIVIGGIVLAAVTSLPNAVAAVYLAKKGRGTAMLSTALNSNALNVAVGFLIPGAVLGLGAAASPEILVVLWYLGLTAIVLLFAYRDRGLRRSRGVVILVAYGCFVAALLADVHGWSGLFVLGAPAVLVVALAGAMLVRPAHDPTASAADHDPAPASGA